MPPKPVVYRGIPYGSRRELCREYGIDEHLLADRLRQGWTIEEAVETVPGEKAGGGIPVEYDGVRYPSLKSMAEELGLSVSGLQHAYYRTKDIRQSVEYCRDHDRREDMTLWGKTYQSLAQVSLVFGISHYHLVTQVREGKCLQEVVKRALETEPVQFHGKRYEHFSDLCAEYGMQPVNVYDRLRYGMELEDALTRPVRGMGNKREVSYQGVDYESHVALCRDYGISVCCVREQLKTNPLTFLEAFEVLVRLKEKLGMGKEELLNYIPHCRIRGKNYKTVAGLLREFAITASAFYVRKNRSEEKEIFSVLKEMQTEKRRAYMAEGKPLLRTQLLEMGYTESRIDRLPRVEVPKYPKLQEFDLDTGCMDGEKLYYEILNEKLQEARQTQEEGMGMKME